MKQGMKTTLRVGAWSTSSLLLFGAVAGVADAATSHAKKTKSTTARDDAGPGAVRPGGPGGPQNVVHGIATVENSDGSFDKYANQAGKVTAISAASITVVSADKYSATYAIDSDTVVVKKGAKAAVGDVADGDTVFVRAEQGSDESYTAEVIGDGKPPAGRGGPGHPGGPGGPGGPGAPGAPGGGEGAS